MMSFEFGISRAVKRGIKMEIERIGTIEKGGVMERREKKLGEQGGEKQATKT